MGGLLCITREGQVATMHVGIYAKGRKASAKARADRCYTRQGGPHQSRCCGAKETLALHVISIYDRSLTKYQDHNVRVQ